MSPRFRHINAFTAPGLLGNPAAVVLLHQPLPDTWMQRVAREFNLSETAFLLPCDASGITSTCDAGAIDWRLRWFTPRAEVDLCGHATLASAHALRDWDLARASETKFHTRSGILAARLGHGDITLDFPIDPLQEIEAPPGLAQVLGLDARAILWCGRSRSDIVLELGIAQDVAQMRPDFARLRVFQARGVAVTARGDGRNCDFVSRFFAPRIGIDEDPVTGSVHCALAPLWAARLGKSALTARQLSERGGLLGLQVLEDRVELRGSCATIMSGEILLTD